MDVYSLYEVQIHKSMTVYASLVDVIRGWLLESNFLPEPNPARGFGSRSSQEAVTILKIGV